MQKQLLRFILLLSSISFILFLIGFLYAVQDLLHPKGSPVPELEVEEQSVQQKSEDHLLIVGLGDSLTRGVGDSEGMGYIGRVANGLKELKQDISVTNLAVSGAKTSDLLALLMKSGVQYSLAKADLILLTIGGNDLNPGWDKLGEIDLNTYRGDIESFRKNGKAILDLIRSVNETSPIYWLGLYDPFEDIPELKGSTQNVISWNSALMDFAADYKEVYMIPIYDLFQGQTKKLLYTDHFHPNQMGYRLMAERVLQKITNQLGLEQKEDGSDER